MKQLIVLMFCATFAFASDCVLTVNPITGRLDCGSSGGAAATAEALATNPSACVAGKVVSDVAADGTLTCTDAPGWRTYTVAYTDSAFIAADTDVDAALFTLPANGVIEGVRIKHSVAVAGTSVTSFKCSVGTATDGDAYSPVHDAFVAAADTAQTFDGGAYSTSASEHAVVLACTSNTNVGDGASTVLTAGSITVHVRWSQLP